jgi:hypothetical protein
MDTCHHGRPPDGATAAVETAESRRSTARSRRLLPALVAVLTTFGEHVDDLGDQVLRRFDRLFREFREEATRAFA